MNLAMTVGAKDDALIEFGFHSFPTARITLLRYTEVLVTIGSVMKFQCVRATVISANFTASAFVGNCFSSRILPSSADTLYQVFSPVRITPYVTHLFMILVFITAGCSTIELPRISMIIGILMLLSIR